MIVNKEVLKEYNSILLVLENCDAYEIPVADILDISCEIIPIGKRDNGYRTDDGFIKISSRAKDTIECSILKNKEDIGTEWDCRLKERLQMCGGCADITSIALRKKPKPDMDIYVPYEPLEDVVWHNEIEYSNCPSFEIDEKGDMIISFGESSKQPIRKDNNYDELIVGWKDKFKKYLPQILEVKLEKFSTFGEEKTNISVELEICDKKSPSQLLELIFTDCKNLMMDVYFPKKGECDVVMSKMVDGRIYVGFDGLGIGFICASILENDYYNNMLENVIS